MEEEVGEGCFKIACTLSLASVPNALLSSNQRNNQSIGEVINFNSVRIIVCRVVNFIFGWITAAGLSKLNHFFVVELLLFVYFATAN